MRVALPPDARNILALEVNDNMHRVISSVLCSTALLVGTSAAANAAIIFEAAPGFVQPDENLLFNDEGLFTGPGLTIEGATNQTNTVFGLTGTVNLVAPSQGQARVEDEQSTGFNSLVIQALADDTFFAEFEANLNASADGVATVLAIDSLGMGYNFSFDIDAAGQNFFGLQATEGTLIRSVLITTDASLDDVRQIRLGGITTDDGSTPPDNSVPEPTSLLLMGSALVAARVVSRRRH